MGSGMRGRFEGFRERFEKLLLCDDRGFEL